MPGARVPAATHNDPQAHSPGSMPAPGCAAADSGPSLPPADSAQRDGAAAWMAMPLAPTRAGWSAVPSQRPARTSKSHSAARPLRCFLVQSQLLAARSRILFASRPALQNTVKPGFFGHQTSQYQIISPRPLLRSSDRHNQPSVLRGLSSSATAGTNREVARSRGRARTWAAARRPQTKY